MKTIESILEKHGVVADVDYEVIAEDIKIAIADHLKFGIKAKALRKKGTNEWYHYLDQYHSYVALNTFKELGQSMIDHQDIHPFPADAELIDITIIVNEP